MSKEGLMFGLTDMGRFSASRHFVECQFRSVFSIQLGKKVFGFAAHHVGMIIKDNGATSARNLMTKLKKAKCHCTRLNAFLQSAVHYLTELIDEFIIKFILRVC